MKKRNKRKGLVGVVGSGKKAKELGELVKRLVKWRKDNKLTQAGVAEAFASCGVPIDIRTIQQWEQGRYNPSRLAAAAMEKFLGCPPKITDAPPYGKQSRLTPDEVAEIREAAREGTQTMKAIGERFGVSESYISRIVAGERLSEGNRK